MTREEIIGKVLDTVLWTRNASGDNKNILTNALVKALEKEPILDKIRAEIDELYSYVEFDEDLKTSFNMVRLEEVQRVIDKYKAESEDNNAEVN